MRYKYKKPVLSNDFLKSKEEIVDFTRLFPIMKNTELAERFNIRKDSVWRWAGKLGLKKKNYVSRSEVTVKHKVCSRCKENLPAIQFNLSRRNKDKLGHYCKSCSSARYKSNIVITSLNPLIDKPRKRVKAQPVPDWWKYQNNILYLNIKKMDRRPKWLKPRKAFATKQIFKEYQKGIYNTTKWRLYSKTKRLSSPKCNMCKTLQYDYQKLCIDHIIPIEDNGAHYSDKNTQCLCKTPCHQRKTRRDQIKRNKGTLLNIPKRIIKTGEDKGRFEPI
jgi:5-methylcytosine-specific restriction endonuclease McrA